MNDIELSGLGYGRLSISVTILRAEWRQIFEEAWAEKEKRRPRSSADNDPLSGGDGIEDELTMGKGFIPWQPHLSLAVDLFATPRSQCRLRNMGMSENAQNRWVLILALVAVRDRIA